MPELELDPVQCRVLGCLVEKEKATPQNYPLTLNSLRLACNQTTNRSPILDLGDREIEEALLSMREARLIRNVYSTSNRATKYRHVLDEAWGLSDPEQAVLAVLMLRGAQTVGEIKARTERLADIPDLGAAEAVLDGLRDREEPLVELLERLPGQKDARWVHLVAGEEHARAMGQAVSAAGPATGAGGGSARIDELEAEVARLRAEVDALRQDLDAFRSEFA